MSSWVRVLVLVVVGSFAALALVFVAEGDFKAASGALIPAALLSPALLEVWRPGKYILRAPNNGSPDTLFGRMKQFRLDHPGLDGTLILGVLAIFTLGLLASSLVRVVQALL